MGVLETKDVKAGLDKVLSSAVFAGSPQLQAFLSFVVETKLDGRERQIKGYTIAVEGLGRAEDFDPQIDPIVRVEGARLRRALEAYYQDDGKDDPIIISIPKGTYVPEFDRNLFASAQKPKQDTLDKSELAVSAAEAASQFANLGEIQSSQNPFMRGNGLTAFNPFRNWKFISIAGITLIIAVLVGGTLNQKGFFPGSNDINFAVANERERLSAISFSRSLYPTIFVEPVEEIDMNGRRDIARSAQFSGAMVSALARFQQIRVVLDKEKATYLLRGVKNLRDFQNTVEFVLIRNDTRNVVWSSSHDSKVDEKLKDDPDTVLIRKVSSALAQSYGVIMADQAGASQDDGDVKLAYECILLAFEYFDKYDAQTHVKSKDCLQQFVRQFDTFSEAYANLAYLYLDEERAGYNPEDTKVSALDRALMSAKRAVSLEPQNPYANQALMDVQFTRGDYATALKTAPQVLLLNPYDPEGIADVGATYVQIGNLSTGIKLLEEAYFYNPARPLWYEFYLFLGYMQQNKYEQAAAHANNMVGDDYSLTLLARSAAAHYNGARQQVKVEIDKLVQLDSNFKEDFTGNVVKALGNNRATKALIEEFRNMQLEEFGVIVEPLAS